MSTKLMSLLTRDLDNMTRLLTFRLICVDSFSGTRIVVSPAPLESLLSLCEMAILSSASAMFGIRCQGQIKMNGAVNADEKKRRDKKLFLSCPGGEPDISWRGMESPSNRSLGPSPDFPLYGTPDLTLVGWVWVRRSWGIWPSQERGAGPVGATGIFGKFAVRDKCLRPIGHISQHTDRGNIPYFRSQAGRIEVMSCRGEAKMALTVSSKVGSTLLS